MAKVIFNRTMKYSNGSFYYECLGATKPQISVRKTDNVDIEEIKPNITYNLSLKLVNDPKTPTVILSKPTNNSYELYIVYIPDHNSYSQDIIIGEPIWKARTSNNLGEKNIYIFKAQDVIIREGQYKERKPAYYIAFDDERKEWRYLGKKADILEKQNDRLCQKVIEAQGWAQEIIEL